MTEKHYDWRNGPAVIQQHSIAKHRILQSYLADYFQTLASIPGQEILKLTLVDGFSGGGRYIHADSKELINGSPLIFLNAVKEAGFLINQNRRKLIHLDVSYFFIDSNLHANRYLERVLREEGYEKEIGNTIHLRHAKFQDEVNGIIEFIQMD
jgi:three-Cys-motif partner protein